MGVLSFLFGSKKSRSGSGAPSTRSDWIVGKIPGPGTYSFDVVGESKYQRALSSICGGKTFDGHRKPVTAHLVHEDDNPHDSYAVRVDIHGKTVGYLSRELAREFRKSIAELGHPGLTAKCNALIVGGWNRGDGDTGHFGVKLDLPTP